MLATTQVATAKYPPLVRKTRKEIGSAITAHAIAAIGMTVNGSMPPMAPIRTP